MKNLTFRAPGVPLSLNDVLARAWPLSTAAQRRAAIGTGQVRVEGVVVREAGSLVEAGAKVEANVGRGGAELVVPGIAVVERGEDWVAVIKPAGLPSHAPEDGVVSAREVVAGALGWTVEETLPVHRLDAAVGGVWLVARGAEAAGRLGAAFEQRLAHKTYLALAPEGLWRDGVVRRKIGRHSAESRIRVVESRGGIGCYELEPLTGRTHQLRLHMQHLGAPILGDALYEGVMVEGGLRLWSHRLVIEGEGIDVSAALREGSWPGERVFAPELLGDAARDQAPCIVVSAATIKAMRRGHPWVLTDTETKGTGRFAPGSLVGLAEAGKPAVATVCVEGTGVVAARLWSWGDPARQKLEGPEARVAAALARRSALLGDPKTEALRLVHGESDGLPGLHVDLLGPVLRVLIKSPAAVGFRDRALEAVRRGLPAARQPEAVVEVVHLREAPGGDMEGVRVIEGALPFEAEEDRFVVRERGLAFRVETGLKDPTRPRPGVGLFMDQRANRDRLAALAPEGRWLNLFAHTGAFSVALLAAGARSVVSVDLSRPYLDWLEDNLALNGLDDGRHESVKSDVRRFLERAEGAPYDGIILDPPTAASAGRQFWSVKRDGQALIARCLALLAPGGALLVCRNDKRRTVTLEAIVRAAAEDAGTPLMSVEAAGPGPDFPALEGFPEGDSFEGVLACRRPVVAKARRDRGR